jgi:cell division protein FtsB
VFARLRPYLPLAILAFFIVYFSIQALTGDRGLLSSSLREQTLASKRAELKRLKTQRLELEARAKLLRDTSLSRDLLEERSRSLLGLSDPRDYVIRTGATNAR